MASREREGIPLVVSLSPIVPRLVDRIWLWVYYNKIPIYPIFYLLKGDYIVTTRKQGLTWGARGIRILDCGYKVDAELGQQLRTAKQTLALVTASCMTGYQE